MVRIWQWMKRAGRLNVVGTVISEHGRREWSWWLAGGNWGKQEIATELHGSWRCRHDELTQRRRKAEEKRRVKRHFSAWNQWELWNWTWRLKKQAINTMQHVLLTGYQLFKASWCSAASIFDEHCSTFSVEGGCSFLIFFFIKTVMHCVIWHEHW